MDGQEIATAKKMKRNEVIEFDFNHHSMLEIVGETKGAIQFNKFEVLSCQSMPGINADGTTTTVAGKRTTTAGKRTTVKPDFSKLFERHKNVYYCQVFTIYHVIYAIIANFGKQQKVY